MSGLGKGGKGKGGSKHAFATERQRREQLNGKFLALKNLVPSPTKSDRASIVHDAIEYIKELLRTVEELKILVDKKRYGTERSKKRKTEDEATGDMESSSMKPHSFLTEREQSNGPSRATWIQRKSKEAEVDVRIVEDEITIKLIQRKKINCLLSLSKILDKLHLDLLHMYEGSSVHGIAIANKLIETVDKNYAAFQPGNF
ncbi:Transcription factor eat1 [Thalictrum thalictroides]|uniref:Transcription factor eat1 n=1 Tax=Thalictrum thalictroides TaxID=46969 RepID=A0A7J6W3D7_THATH|nr:Transcription factor eat1 [Thalictrum thalictroides]